MFSRAPAQWNASGATVRRYLAAGAKESRTLGPAFGFGNRSAAWNFTLVYDRSAVLQFSGEGACPSDHAPRRLDLRPGKSGKVQISGSFRSRSTDGWNRQTVAHLHDFAIDSPREKDGFELLRPSVAQVTTRSAPRHPLP